MDTKKMLENMKKAREGDKKAQKEVLIYVQQTGNSQKYLSDEEFAEQFANARKGAEADRKDGEIGMMFFLHGTPYDLEAPEEDKHLTMPVLFGDWPPDQKEGIMMGLGAKFAEEFPNYMLTNVVQVAEAWMVKHKKDTDLDKVSAPSKDPNKIEVVIVSAVSFDKRASVYTGEIKYGKDGKYSHLKTQMEKIHDPKDPLLPGETDNNLANMIYHGYMAARKKEEEDDAKN